MLQRVNIDGHPEMLIMRGTEVVATVHDLGEERRDDMIFEAMLMAQAPELAGALSQVYRWQEAIDNDEPINGGDLVEWFVEFYHQAFAALTKAGC